MESPIWFILFVAMVYLTYVSKKRRKNLKNVQKSRKYKIKKDIKKEKELFDGTGKGFGFYYPPQEKYCENKVFPGSYLTPYDMTRSRDCECAKVCNNNSAQCKNMRG